MQQKNSREINGHLDEIRKALRVYFSDKIKDVLIAKNNECEKLDFRIEFTLYNYCYIIFNYHDSIINSEIYINKHCSIDLIEGKHNYSDNYFELYCTELDKEVRLRIPDKFLLKNGWL